MLTWTKRKIEFGYTININNTDKTLIITFGGNLDLYWYLDAKNDKEKVITFEITKENYSLFLLFDKLYNDIVNCNLFKVHDEEKNFINSSKELIKLYNKKAKINEIFKQSEEYKKYIMVSIFVGIAMIIQLKMLII